jgi:hypothetical protein
VHCTLAALTCVHAWLLCGAVLCCADDMALCKVHVCSAAPTAALVFLQIACSSPPFKPCGP